MGKTCCKRVFAPTLKRYGAIGYYYNYAVVTPFYGDLKNTSAFYELEEERAKPGCYSVRINDVLCALTVNSDTAFHRYTFLKCGGRLAVDFSNDGLLKKFGRNYYGYPKEAKVILAASDTVYFSAELSGIKLYFCLKVFGDDISGKLFENTEETSKSELNEIDSRNPFGAVFDFSGNTVFAKLSFSTKSFERAEENINMLNDSFCDTAKKAYDIWNEHLSAIDIETDDEGLVEKFYSNFYHSKE